MKAKSLRMVFFIYLASLTIISCSHFGFLIPFTSAYVPPLETMRFINKRALLKVSLPSTFRNIFRMKSEKFDGSGISKSSNLLSNETSPYLLQHANNPIHWRPWNTDAFEKAKKEDKPIFLSIGYSTCHWCHVMEKESFESQAVAKLLNEKFVPIKVDREERPDVDAVYMTFIQATAGRGGWPMSIWLSPDLKPFVGGTYFPEDRFISILNTVSEKWETDRPEILERGNNIIEALQRFAEKEEALLGDSSALVKSGGWRLVEELYKSLEEDFDEEWGGFGRSLKFPQPTQLNFLLRLYYDEPATDRGKKALSMLVKTLEGMAKGGIRDHLGGGFARYSTDRRWHVPHFEKMLYDNAQLAVTYLEAFQVTENKLFKEVAQEILDYVLREMTDAEGGFYSAEDADSFPDDCTEGPDQGITEKKEGAFYVFSWAKLQEVLKDTGSLMTKEGEPVDIFDIFCRMYGARMLGNVDPAADPHGELRGQNCLYLANNLEDLIESFELGCTVQDLQIHMNKCVQLLFDAQSKRTRPHLDDKIIASWNGLMISAFAKGWQVLGNEKYILAAEKATRFIKQKMYDSRTHTLLRSYRKGPSDISGFADDYSFLIAGLIDLYEANFDESLLEWAYKLQNTLDSNFYGKGMYFASSTSDTSILLRTKSNQDGAEPCTTSVAAWNLIKLGQYCDDPKLTAKGEEVMAATIQEAGGAVMRPGLVGATVLHLKGFKQIVIFVPETDIRQLPQFASEINKNFIPNKAIFVVEQSQIQDRMEKGNRLSNLLQSMQDQTPDEGQIAVYICENFTCLLPITTIGKIQEALAPKF